MTPVAQQVLQSARLVLRPVDEADVSVLRSWWNDATVRAMHGLGLEPIGPEVVRRWIDEPGRVHAWVARALSDGAAVGVIEMSPAGMRRADGTSDAYELGIAVDSTARGRGLGREMVERLCAWAFETAGAQCVMVEVMEHNAVARRLFDCTGFAAIGPPERGILRMRRLRTSPMESP